MARIPALMEYAVYLEGLIVNQLNGIVPIGLSLRRRSV